MILRFPLLNQNELAPRQVTQLQHQQPEWRKFLYRGALCDPGCIAYKIALNKLVENILGAYKSSPTKYFAGTNFSSSQSCSEIFYVDWAQDDGWKDKVLGFYLAGKSPKEKWPTNQSFPECADMIVIRSVVKPGKNRISPDVNGIIIIFYGYLISMLLIVLGCPWLMWSLLNFCIDGMSFLLLEGRIVVFRCTVGLNTFSC